MKSKDTGIVYELSRKYSASKETLFNALTSSAVLKRIWDVQSIDVDARVGGQAVATYIAEGQDWSFTITYDELSLDDGRWPFAVVSPVQELSRKGNEGYSSAQNGRRQHGADAANG